MNNNFNIIGIDPGTNTGISIYTIDSTTMSIVNIETMTLVLNNHTDSNDPLDRVLEKLLYLNKCIDRLYHAYNPIAIALETSFLHMRFPKAVIQLSQFIATIELRFKQLNPLINFFRFPPTLIKKHFTATGTSNKDDMFTAMSKIPEVYTKVNTLGITEHEVDAIAIGYLLLNLFRIKPHLMFGYF